MKLLILTQKVDINDDVLGFMHGWIIEFAKHCKKVTVIALGVGEYDLPENVKVLSLGKEKGESKLKYIINFYKYIWRERKNYDSVFVHMNPEYIVFGGWPWKLWNKKVGLWYTHRNVDLKLRVAEKLVDIIFTSSQESFRLVSSKVNFMGHGINLEEFKVENQKNIIDNIFNIIYVGRVSLIKNQKLLIEAVNILVNQYNIKNIKINLIGGASNSKDEDYIAELKRLIEKYKLSNFINFLGSVPHREIRRYYEKADLSINLCPTGGMDKTVLESMAASLPVVVYNKAFASTLKDFANLLVLNQTDAAELAEKIKKIIVLEKSERVNLNNYLLKSVEKFSIVNLIKTITDKYIRENKNIT